MTLLLALFYHNSCQNLWNYLVRLFELLDFWSNKKKWRICKIWMQTQLIMDYDISIPPNCQRRRLLFLLHCFREKSELQTPSYGGCKASHWWSRTQTSSRAYKLSQRFKVKTRLNSVKSSVFSRYTKGYERENYYQMDTRKRFRHYFIIKCEKFLCLFFIKFYLLLDFVF